MAGLLKMGAVVLALSACAPTFNKKIESPVHVELLGLASDTKTPLFTQMRDATRSIIRWCRGGLREGVFRIVEDRAILIVGAGGGCSMSGYDPFEPADPVWEPEPIWEFDETSAGAKLEGTIDTHDPLKVVLRSGDLHVQYSMDGARPWEIVKTVRDAVGVISQTTENLAPQILKAYVHELGKMYIETFKEAERMGK